MNEFTAIQLISAIACLVLVLSGVAGYRLGWKENIRLALVWAGIFIAVALVFSLAMG